MANVKVREDHHQAGAHRGAGRDGHAHPNRQNGGRFIGPRRDIDARRRRPASGHHSPSYLLRLIDPADKTREYRRFVEDLRTCKELALRAA